MITTRFRACSLCCGMLLATSTLLQAIESPQAAAGMILLDFGQNSISTNSPHTGAAGTVTLDFTDHLSGYVQVTATVKNTTGQTTFGAGATSATLTGFGFDLVDGVSYVTNSFVAGTALDTAILDAQASPFGSLDFAAADNGNFLGANANGGLSTGSVDVFSLGLHASLNSPALTAAAMMQQFQTAFGNPTDLDAVMRFQQVNAGAGSDKLLYVDPDPNPNPTVPEPSSIAFWSLMAFAGMKRRRQR